MVDFLALYSVSVLRTSCLIPGPPGLPGPMGIPGSPGHMVSKSPVAPTNLFHSFIHTPTYQSTYLSIHPGIHPSFIHSSIYGALNMQTTFHKSFHSVHIRRSKHCLHLAAKKDRGS